SGTAIAATVLPWWKRDLYQKSPIVRYSVAGLPLISIAGAITTIFLGWILYEWLFEGVTDATPAGLYGIGAGNSGSVIFLAILYGIAALVYVVARFYRRSQGIDLDAIHSEIPSE